MRGRVRGSWKKQEKALERAVDGTPAEGRGKEGESVGRVSYCNTALKVSARPPESASQSHPQEESCPYRNGFASEQKWVQKAAARPPAPMRPTADPSLPWKSLPGPHLSSRPLLQI